VSSAPLAAVREALAGERAWVVGGALRDQLLGRLTPDIDLVTSGDPGRCAKALAHSTRATVFALSEEFGAWRVVERGRAWQVDISPLRGETIEQDLALRDFGRPPARSEARAARVRA
jgi:poly(A) polymerase